MSAFRSHATIGFIVRDRIQPYYTNRSVVLVSSAIGFGGHGETGGLDKLTAIVIAFSRLSLRDNGILHNLQDGKLFEENEQVGHFGTHPDPPDIQKGKKLVFEKDGDPEALPLTYGKLTSCESSPVGRSITVLHATSTEAQDLVVKINWPGSGRVSETKFLEAVIEKAEDTPNKWAPHSRPPPALELDRTFLRTSSNFPFFFLPRLRS